MQRILKRANASHHRRRRRVRFEDGVITITFESTSDDVATSDELQSTIQTETAFMYNHAMGGFLRVIQGVSKQADSQQTPSNSTDFTCSTQSDSNSFTRSSSSSSDGDKNSHLLSTRDVVLNNNEILFEDDLGINDDQLKQVIIYYIIVALMKLLL